MFGLLNLYKSIGQTSRDCVNDLQRIIRPIKCGHAGTLDPIAEGVLLVGVGQAVKLIDWLHQHRKIYRAEFMIGSRSESADRETEIQAVENAHVPTTEEIITVAQRFVGQIQQTPPMYSAVWVDGKRAHELARRGIAVELPPRTVSVYSIELITYEYPHITLDVECGTGTYIRTLGQDIMQSLGTDAVMTKLARLSIGPFLMEKSFTIDADASRTDIENEVINPVHALNIFPRLSLDEDRIAAILQGKTIGLNSEDYLRVVLGCNAGDDDCDCIDEMIISDGFGNLKSILKRRDAYHWSAKKNFTES